MFNDKKELPANVISLRDAVSPAAAAVEDVANLEQSLIAEDPLNFQFGEEVYRVANGAFSVHSDVLTLESEALNNIYDSSKEASGLSNNIDLHSTFVVLPEGVYATMPLRPDLEVRQLDGTAFYVPKDAIELTGTGNSAIASSDIDVVIDQAQIVCPPFEEGGEPHIINFHRAPAIIPEGTVLHLVDAAPEISPA